MALLNQGGLIRKRVALTAVCNDLRQGLELLFAQQFLVQLMDESYRPFRPVDHDWESRNGGPGLTYSLSDGQCRAAGSGAPRADPAW